MKMIAEHYGILKDHYTAGLESAFGKSRYDTLEEYVAVIEQKYENYTEQRKLWDLYWAFGGNDWKKVAFNNVYDTTYDDINVQIAIKKIYNDIKNTKE